MHMYYITFRSVTFAQRGERILTEGGFRCSLQRTPRWMEAQGCGYAVRLWAKDIQKAAALLNQNRIPLRRIYVQEVGGGLEEVAT